MLLLALLLPPVAVYLLVLGWINRRPRPVMMGGGWEFAGLLFALSGTLLIGGPAFLSYLDEQSRRLWLLGETEPAPASSAGAETQLGRPNPAELAETEAARNVSRGDGTTVGIAAHAVYFVLVAGVAAFVLWRSRRLTSIYNVDSGTILAAIEQAFARLGVTATRTGSSFAISGKPPPAAKNGQGGRRAALRVDVFALMRHVTLRWAPADFPARQEVEQELARTLADAAPPEPDALHSGCLTLAGVALLVLALVAGGLLILFRYYPPR